MNLTAIVNQYERVLILLKRPTNEEFKLTTKITFFGLMIIGLFGFVISLSTRYLLSFI